MCLYIWYVRHNTCRLILYIQGWPHAITVQLREQKKCEHVAKVVTRLAIVSWLHQVSKATPPNQAKSKDREGFKEGAREKEPTALW